MGVHIVMWPPPWKPSSPLRRLASYLWLVAMAPVLVLTVAVIAPIALASRLTGWGATTKRTREEVCRTIEEFVNGDGGPWDWDDFTSVPDADPLLEEARCRCLRIPDDYPPEAPDQWCGPKGREELLRIARELRRAES